jgi:hypothetical protein
MRLLRFFWGPLYKAIHHKSYIWIFQGWCYVINISQMWCPWSSIHKK